MFMVRTRLRQRKGPANSAIKTKLSQYSWSRTTQVTRGQAAAISSTDSTDHALRLARSLSLLRTILEAAHGPGAYATSQFNGFRKSAHRIARADGITAAVSWLDDCAALIELGAE